MRFPGSHLSEALESLATARGLKTGGGRARRTPRCPRAPTPPLEVVAESLAPGPQTRPLAVPVRHQGLGRPLEAAFHWQETSAPGLGFWSKQVKTALRQVSAVCSESIFSTSSLVTQHETRQALRTHSRLCNF